VIEELGGDVAVEYVTNSGKVAGIEAALKDMKKGARSTVCATLG
jgi:hypothetical protein